MAYSRSKVVKQAQAWIGLKESDGSHMKIVNIYNNHKPLARGYKLKSTDSWCAATVSAVAIECGYTKIIPTEVSCPQMIELFKKLGEWQENDAYKPSAGDVIFYDWDDSGSGDNRGTSDHVGIVEKVSGNTITVIEGNKNNAVGRRTLKVNGKYIRGYGVPKYDGSGTGSSGSSSSSSKPSGSGSMSGKTVNYKVKIDTPSGVNMRSSAKVTNDNKVYAIPNGETVTITKESGGWGYTSYKGYKGWISLEYTKKVSSGSSSGTGTSGNWVARLQSECNEQGFSNQKVDGIVGKNTLAGCPTARRGASGNITRLIQERLISLGYSCGSSGIDGKFGNGTESAIKAFQKAHSLSADGIVGQKTWRKLLNM